MDSTQWVVVNGEGRKSPFFPSTVKKVPDLEELWLLNADTNDVPI